MLRKQKSNAGVAEWDENLFWHDLMNPVENLKKKEKKKCALVVKLLTLNIVINYKIHLLELCSVTFHCC